MPCDTLAEFRDLARYRKSFNGDLMMAKSRPQKFYYFETFPFESAKGPLLVLGKIDKALLDEVKKLGKTMRAKGECSFKDNVVALNVTDGKITDDQLRKALAHANVRREGSVGNGDKAAPENKGNGEALGQPPEKFSAARAALQKLLDKADDLAWDERELKSGKAADEKLTQVERWIVEVESALAASEPANKLLANQLNVQARDPRAKLFKPELDAAGKLLAKQTALVQSAQTDIAAMRRKLVPLKLLAKELTLSGRVFPLELRSATLKYSVHGDKTRTVHNRKDVIKALGVEITKLAPKPTSTKFLSAELEKEAVDRAIAVAEKECPWTEIQTDGRWLPLNAIVVHVGKPAASLGWHFVSPSDARPATLKTVAEALDEFAEGKLNTNQLMAAVSAAIDALAKHVRGADPAAPMHRSARVTLARQGARWASVSHYPEPGAVPPGWNLKGKPVRLKAGSPTVTAPACRGA